MLKSKRDNEKYLITIAVVIITWKIPTQKITTVVKITEVEFMRAEYPMPIKKATTLTISSINKMGATFVRNQRLSISMSQVIYL